MTRGLALPQISVGRVRLLRVPLPPPPEQKRIVEKVDQLMALCDELEAAQKKRRATSFLANKAALSALTSATGTKPVKDAWKRVQDNFEVLYDAPETVQDLRQSILQLAVMGKLVRQDPRDEPAGKLLELASKVRIEELESGRPYAKRKAPDTPLAQREFELPDGWVWAWWHEVGLCQNGRAFPSSDYTIEGTRLLRPGNLHSSGRVTWTRENTRHLPDAYAVTFPEYIVGGNELVMNLTAQSLKDDFLGRVCKTDRTEHALLNQRIARLTPLGLDRDYCRLAFSAPPYRRYVRGLNKGTLIQHMFTSQVYESLLPVPPLSEQERIVAKVDQLMALCDELDTLLQRSRIDGEALMKAVVEHLVAAPQAPSEPMAMVG